LASLHTTSPQCDLIFTEDGLTALAKDAIAKKTGARGLRSIVVRAQHGARGSAVRGPSWAHVPRATTVGLPPLTSPQERLLLPAMYDVPQSDIHTVVVDAAVVQGKRPAHYFRGEEQPSASLIGADLARQRAEAAKASRTPPPPSRPAALADEDEDYPAYSSSRA